LLKKIFPFVLSKTAGNGQARIIFNEVRFAEGLCYVFNQVISEPVPVQIINKKSPAAILFQPLQHLHQLFICKMMAKKRRKNNVGFFS
jgi:hypothetical protein